MVPCTRVPMPDRFDSERVLKTTVTNFIAIYHLMFVPFSLGSAAAWHHHRQHRSSASFVAISRQPPGSSRVQFQNLTGAEAEARGEAILEASRCVAHSALYSITQSHHRPAGITFHDLRMRGHASWQTLHR